MASEMASMLDELMGANRNDLPGESSDLGFEHPRVCKYFLAGFCPHELFTNTKYDLGVCKMLHDSRYKAAYTESPLFEKVSYEDKFVSFLHRLQNTMQDKIRRHKERLKLTQRDIESHQETSSQRGDANREQMVVRIEQLTVHISAAVDAVDTLHLAGKTEASSAQGQVADQLKMERTSLNEQLLRYDADNGGSGGGRALEVCDTCGCFLVWNDAEVRVSEHLQGKLHMGYSKIAVTIDEMEKRFKEKVANRKVRSPTPERKRRRSRSRERKRSSERSSTTRRHRSRSKEGRDRESTSRRRSQRSRSKDRKSRRSRSRSKDRKSKRSRSRSRDRKKRSRSPRKSSSRRSRSPRHKSDRSHDRKDAKKEDVRNGSSKSPPPFVYQ